jgi:hypothetical protein
MSRKQQQSDSSAYSDEEATYEFGEDRNFERGSFERAIGFPTYRCTSDQMYQIATFPNHSGIKFIPNSSRTQDLCDASFEMDSDNIRYFPISKITPEMCLAMAHESLDNPDVEISQISFRVYEMYPELKVNMMAINPKVVLCFQKRTEENILAAIRLSEMRVSKDEIISYLLERLSKECQTLTVCVAALTVSGLALKYVKQQDPRLTLIACQQNGLALEYARSQTVDLVVAAVTQNPDAVCFCDKKIRVKVNQVLKKK